MEFVEVHETYDPMEAKLIKAKLTDEDIPFSVNGDFEISYSMETFNTSLARMAVKRPIVFYVPLNYFDIAKTAINTDNSSLLDDDLEY